MAGRAQTKATSTLPVRNTRLLPKATIDHTIGDNGNDFSRRRKKEGGKVSRGGGPPHPDYGDEGDEDANDNGDEHAAGVQ